jgi:cytochrome c peroxidase
MRRIVEGSGFVVLFGAFLGGGCVHGAAAPVPAPAVQAQAPVAALSDEELTRVRSTLGTLPAAPPADPTNRYADDPAAAALGQKLYFEVRYSSNGKVSCATCHDPRSGFQDARANTSLGIDFTGRHAPTVINSAFGSGHGPAWQFWDGRADSQWSQALGPPESAVEMGGTRTRISLMMFDHYRSEYQAVFGPMPALRDAAGRPVAADLAMPGTSEWSALPASVRHDITGVYVNFGKAIAAYERKIVSRNSRFDAFLTDLQAGARDSDHLDAEEKLGLRVFVGKGRCVACHSGPNFSDWKFHNIGAPNVGEHVKQQDRGRADGALTARRGEFNCASEWSDEAEKSRCAVNGLAAEDRDLGAFKTPGLRDVSKTGPYMHTGFVATLADVVDYYDMGGAEGGFLGTVDKDVKKLGLTDAEKSALVAFLHALDGQPLPPALTEAPAVP